MSEDREPPAGSRRRRVPAAPARPATEGRVSPLAWVRIPAIEFEGDPRVVALADGGALAWGDDARTFRFVRSVANGVESPPDRAYWRAGPALPGPAFGAPGLRLEDGSVLVVGGADGRAVWRWNPGRDAFEVLRPLHEARHGPALLPVGADGALVIGGLAPDGRPAMLIERVTPTGQFVRGELRRPRPEPLAAAVDDHLVIVGFARSDDVPEVWPITEGPGWLGQPLAEPREEAAAIGLGGQLLLVGGRHRSPHGKAGLIREAVAYDAAADEWREAGRLAKPRRRPKLVPWGPGRCLVVGGGADNPKMVALVESFDGHRWSRGGALNVGRVDHEAVALTDGRILVVGGRTLGELAPPYSELSSRP